jgi:hypothetical protein
MSERPPLRLTRPDLGAGVDADSSIALHLLLHFTLTRREAGYLLSVTVRWVDNRPAIGTGRMPAIVAPAYDNRSRAGLCVITHCAS